GREPLSLTRQRRDRLVLMLRALDGHLCDASYREIAEGLFGAARVEREAWKTSSLRDRTIRLVKSGVSLMRAGYRRLLRGGKSRSLKITWPSREDFSAGCRFTLASAW